MPSIANLLRVASVACMLLLIGGGASPLADASGATNARTGRTTDALGADGLFHCQYCANTSSEHVFINVDCDDTSESCKDCHILNFCHVGDPDSGTCSQHHAPCAVQDLLASLREAVDGGDGAVLANLVRTDDNLVWNAERNLVQVMDCYGAVAAQYELEPVMERQFRAGLSATTPADRSVH